MFDESKVQSLRKDGETPPRDGAVSVTGIGTERDPNRVDPNPNKFGQSRWKVYSVVELIQFRDEITGLLPPLELSKVNLEEELLLQFHTIRGIQTEILNDDEVEPNKKATIANAVTSSLNKLAELQVALYHSERFKELENIMIHTLKQLPEDLAAKFLDKYEKLLETASKK